VHAVLHRPITFPEATIQTTVTFSQVNRRVRASVQAGVAGPMSDRWPMPMSFGLQGWIRREACGTATVRYVVMNPLYAAVSAGQVAAESQGSSRIGSPLHA